MMSASMFAGLAFSNASSRPVHSMANRLGGFYDPPHGDRIAKTLSHVISYDCPFARERYRAIESFMTGAGPVTKDGPGRPAGTAGRNVAPFGDGGWLSEMGVKEEDIPFPVDSALRDPFHLTNPRPFEKREIGAILRCTVNRSPEWRYAGDGLSWS
jgi:alcohol dehydrogenase class IV